MKFVKQLLSRLLGGSTRIIAMDENRQREILLSMSRIDGIDDYLQLMRQAGFQLFSETRDERHLGCVDLANTLIETFKGLRTAPEEEEVINDGFKSTI